MLYIIQLHYFELASERAVVCRYYNYVQIKQRLEQGQQGKTRSEAFQ